MTKLNLTPKIIRILRKENRKPFQKYINLYKNLKISQPHSAVIPMKKNITKFVVTFAILMTMSNASAEKNPLPIKIMTLDWTSQIVLSNIAGQILSNIGYNIEYVPVGSRGQWYMLWSEKAHVQVEVWEGTMAKKFSQLIKSGDIVDAGSHSAKTREEWWYPAYIEEVCPGLPDWQALRRCHRLFSSGDGTPQGIYVGGPWEKPDAARIRALDLNFEVAAVKKGDDLWVKLKDAVKDKKPIVLFNWTPNWVEAVYEGKFVEFPEHDPLCETDPSWGVNQKYTWDCGNPKNGWLKKAAISTMPKEWPCAYLTLRNFSFSNIMIARASVLVDVNNLSHEEAAKRWVSQNESIWRSWIPKQCT